MKVLVLLLSLVLNSFNAFATQSSTFVNPDQNGEYATVQIDVENESVNLEAGTIKLKVYLDQKRVEKEFNIDNLSALEPDSYQYNIVTILESYSHYSGQCDSYKEYKLKLKGTFDKAAQAFTPTAVEEYITQGADSCHQQGVQSKVNTYAKKK